MRYRELAPLHQALAELADMPLPISTAMKVRRIVRALLPQLQDIASEEQKIAAQHVKVDADGKPVVVDGQYTFETEENLRAFSECRRELWELEWQPPEQIAVAELDGREVRPRVLIGLGDVLLEHERQPLP